MVIFQKVRGLRYLRNPENFFNCNFYKNKSSCVLDFAKLTKCSVVPYMTSCVVWMYSISIWLCLYNSLVVSKIFYCTLQHPWLCTRWVKWYWIISNLKFLWLSEVTLSNERSRMRFKILWAALLCSSQQVTEYDFYENEFVKFLHLIIPRSLQILHWVVYILYCFYD